MDLSIVPVDNLPKKKERIQRLKNTWNSGYTY